MMEADCFFKSKSAFLVKKTVVGRGYLQLYFPLVKYIAIFACLM